MLNHYYWSDDWSKEFYIQLASAGFISTSHEIKEALLLLPELQYDYALLDFKDLHISKKVKKLLKKNNYIFSISTQFNEVLTQVSLQHKDNWLKKDYAELLKDLFIKNNTYDNFKIISIELNCKESKRLIAGEVGYIIGKTYTSLSGFSSRDKEYSNYGTLQLVLLSKYLEENGFHFWNLGHPFMEYKRKLGSKIYSREDFLKRWREAIK